MLRRSKRAAVLGCGPAGLFAAHALIRSGWDVEIFSNKRKSDMFGAQYLHKPIDGLTDNPVLLDARLRGTAEEYRTKVYGEGSTVQVSPEVYTGASAVWDIRTAYDAAWFMYEGRIEHYPGIDAGGMGLILSRHYRLVVSSIPAPALCAKVHQFANRKIWAIGDAPERGVKCPIRTIDMTVEYNGEPSPRWYRLANVFDHTTAEWPYEPKPPIEGLSEVVKPLSTTCDCWSGSVIRVGRYGRWEKGVLAHSAYYDVKTAVTK